MQSADKFLFMEKKARLRTYCDKIFSITALPLLYRTSCHITQEWGNLNTFKCLLKHIYSRELLKCNWTVVLHCIVLLDSISLDLYDWIYVLCRDLFTLLICVAFSMYEVCVDIFRVLILVGFFNKLLANVILTSH